MLGRFATYCQEMGRILYFTTLSVVRSVSEPYKTSAYLQQMENNINRSRLCIRSSKLTHNVVKGGKCSSKTNAVRSNKTVQAFSQRCDEYCFDKDPKKCSFVRFFSSLR